MPGGFYAATAFSYGENWVTLPYDKNSKLYRATKKASQKACRFDGLVHEMIVFLIAAHNHTYTRLGPQPAVHGAWVHVGVTATEMREMQACA